MKITNKKREYIYYVIQIIYNSFNPNNWKSYFKLLISNSFQQYNDILIQINILNATYFFGKWNHWNQTLVIHWFIILYLFSSFLCIYL